MSQTSGRRSDLGKVFLVGAGPGDPGLITLRAIECLRTADLVLYDYLVNPAIVEHVRVGAELIGLGHHGGGRELSQEQINARMVAAARLGRTVVRLKGGDPDIFGRGADELEALRAAGIAYEIVPGVTAALAAAGYAEIPITHGGYCSAVALVTGQQRQQENHSRLDYRALADFPGTLIFYMGVTSAAEWSGALLERGKPPDTPVAVVRRCSWPDQLLLRCTLASVAEVVAQRRIRPPAVIVVGEVVDHAPQVSWFTARPLFGTRVMLTRPRDEALLPQKNNSVSPAVSRPDRRGESPHQDSIASLTATEPLRDRLSALGAEIFMQPAISISNPPDWQPVDAALTRLDQYDWLVFSSVHGVRYLLGRLLGCGGDARRLGRVKLAAIGPGTAEELLCYHLHADLVPAQFRAESLAEALLDEAPGGRFLLARASRGRDVLPERLTAAGAKVEQIVVYTSSDVKQADPEVAAALRAGRIDWITVTSSAIARSLVALFGDDLRRSRLLSISPVTSGVLRELGFEPAAEAAEYTMSGLIEAILDCQ